MRFKLKDLVESVCKKRKYKHVIVEDIANLLFDEFIDKIAEGNEFFERGFMKIYIVPKMISNGVKIMPKLKLSRKYRNFIVKKYLEEAYPVGKNKEETEKSDDEQ